MQTNSTDNTDNTPGARVRYIGSPGVQGTFVAYYLPLPGGTIRRTNITWDDGSMFTTPLETQIEAF